MGQNESNTIQQINPIQYSERNEWTNYMEWTNYKNLKKDEKYRMTFESYKLDIICCYYSFDKYDHENCDAIFTDNIIIRQMIVLNITNSYQKKNTNQK